jgi:hypothetical protein
MLSETTILAFLILIPVIFGVSFLAGWYCGMDYKDKNRG